MKDWLFSGKDYVCDVRVAGVLVRDGKILLQRDNTGTEYAVPGGHIHIGETLENGLVREYFEETGVQIQCLRLLWTEECFFEWKSKQVHNLTFYYMIELRNVADLPDQGEFVPQKDNCHVLMGWMPIAEIEHLTIFPEFIKQTIHHLDAPTAHFITRA